MFDDRPNDNHAPRHNATTDSGSKGTALITGASAGIGAVYADRLARRGHDLILVARNQDRLDALATRLTADTRRSIRVLAADLNDDADLARVEQMLRTDPTITMLVNNAGIGSTAPFLDADIERLVQMVAINITALVRLAHASAPAFVQRGGGTIINIASAVALWPELLNGVYGGTKAFVLAFSLSLDKELSESRVRVQAVLPGAVDTGFWSLAGTPVDQLPRENVMDAEDLVDAALAGLDQGELVTIPSLTDVSEWDAYEAARHLMMPKLSLSSPADRYGIPQRTVLQR